MSVSLIEWNDLFFRSLERFSHYLKNVFHQWNDWVCQIFFLFLISNSKINFSLSLFIHSNIRSRVDRCPITINDHCRYYRISQEKILLSCHPQIEYVSHELLQLLASKGVADMQNALFPIFDESFPITHVWRCQLCLSMSWFVSICLFTYLFAYLHFVDDWLIRWWVSDRDYPSIVNLFGSIARGDEWLGRYDWINR